jgi:hypothetical protein
MPQFLGRDADDPTYNWLEDHLQMYIVQEAKRAGYYLAADFNAGKRNHSKAKAMGLLPGVPDLRFYFALGKLVWIELKRTKGKLSPEQIAHHAFLKRNGHAVFIVFAQTPLEAWQRVEAIVKNYDKIR